MNVRFCFVLAACRAGGVELHAQTVQLPTFHSYSSSIDVLVPDQGQANLGGVRRAASGRIEFGAPFLPGQRAGGWDRQSAGISVTAKIHDFEAQDSALHKAATARRASGQAAQNRLKPRGATLGMEWASQPPLASVGELRSQRLSQSVEREQEAQALMARAAAAEAHGKPSLAKIYYQMAARNSTGPIKQDALKHLRQLPTAPGRHRTVAER